MAGSDPAIHVFTAFGLKAWMSATRAGMTTGVLYFNQPLSRSTVSRQSFSEPAKDRRM